MALNILKLLLVIFSGMPHFEINLLKASKNDFTGRSEFDINCTCPAICEN